MLSALLERYNKLCLVASLPRRIWAGTAVISGKAKPLDFVADFIFLF
jgi:hypothetical protein